MSNADLFWRISGDQNKRIARLTRRIGAARNQAASRYRAASSVTLAASGKIRQRPAEYR